VLDDRVGDAVLVDGLKTALELHRRYSSVDYLTKDGDVVYASGIVVSGGKMGGDQGLLNHRRRMEETRAEARRETEAVALAQQQLDVCRRELADAEAVDSGRREEFAACERRLIELDLQSRHASEERERTGRRDSVLADELAALAEERERLTAELAVVQESLATAESKDADLERELTTRTAGLATLESEARRLADVVSNLNAERAVLAERRDSMEQEAARLAETLLDLDGRVGALQAEAASARRRAEQAAELKEQTEKQLVEHLAEREALAGKTQEMEREIAERRKRLAAGEHALRDDRAELEQLRAATRHAELERTRAESDRSHLDEICNTELGVVAEEAAYQAGEEALATVDESEVAETIAQLKGKIERLGPVNMTAIEEFSELEERHGFLTSQRQDLEEAMGKLRDTIRRINRTSRERFIEAFDAIRASYQEVFKVLFNGGKADLILEEGEDVLDCGIEIMVQPPGKRLGAVQLMSGGEKALSAVALLFAIFRYQPSPFCLLDEVDAPLDDTNVARFTRLLQEYAKNTQFIIVTHNKLSMEAADLLYGVTMEEPGVSKLMSLQLH
jgi:chromosome segregation protein